MTKSLILISNDDGITSKGIKTLVEVMKELGDVIVVAPDSPQSGMGHAITVGDTLRLEETSIFDSVRAFECSGTPADCVKMARHFVLKDEREPDIIVSGINHGSNTSISVLYSGTMSAAIEGAIEGTPAIGFSLCDYGSDPDFSHTREYIKKIVKQVCGSPPSHPWGPRTPGAREGPPGSRRGGARRTRRSPGRMPPLRRRRGQTARRGRGPAAAAKADAPRQPRARPGRTRRGGSDRSGRTR